MAGGNCGIKYGTTNLFFLSQLSITIINYCTYNMFRFIIFMVVKIILIATANHSLFLKILNEFNYGTFLNILVKYLVLYLFTLFLNASDEFMDC